MALGIAAIAGMIYVWRAPLAPDFDLFLHIKTGELIARAGHWLTQDPFTFAAHGQPEENHSWLSQLLFFWVFRAGGEAGMRLLNVGLLAVTAGAVIYRLRRTIGPWLPGLGLLGLFLIQRNFQVIRPLLFGQAAFALLTLIGWRDPRGPVKWGWWVALVFLWGNLHGSVLVVFPVLFLFLAIRYAIGAFCRRDAVGAALLVVAAFLNPSGPSLLGQAAEMSALGQAARITEWLGRAPVGWRPLDPYDSRLRISLVLVDGLMLLGIGTGLALVVRRWRQRNWVALYPAALLLFFSLLPLLASRHLVFLFLPWVLLLETLEERRAGIRRLVAPVYLGALALLLISVSWRSQPTTLAALQAATQRLERAGLAGPVLNFPAWGGYLAFAGYPRWPTLADSRVRVNREYYRFEAAMVERDGGLRLETIADRYPQARIALYHAQADGRELERRGWKPFFQEGEVKVWVRVP